MLKITMIIVMTFFTIILTPHERAAANPLAVGGALYLGGAGVYVVGAVGIAAIAGLAGCDSCEEDINEHAARTWQGSTQLVKDGVQLMVDASVGAWGATSSALTSVDANVNTWVDGQLAGFATAAIASKYSSVNANTTDFTYYTNNSTMKNVSVTTAAKATKGYFAKGVVFDEVQILHYSGSFIRVNFNYPMAGSTLTSLQVTYNSGTAGYEKYSAMWAGAISTSTVLSLAKAMGASFAYGMKSTMQSDYANVNANATEAWEEMTDAGLVLPTDTARPLAGNIPLTYDPVTDAYAGIDGVNVPREDITGYDYGKPHWKTLEDLAMLGLSGLGAGLYIDGWAGSDSITSVYDPVTDTTTTSTTTSGTTTNVTTGETVTTDAVTSSTTTTGDTTGESSSTPEGETPKTQTGKSSRWGKLVTTKFPFSLPWDLFFILSFLNADPVTPVFSIDERINKRENVEGIQIKFDIDLSFLDPYVPWFRRFIVLGFAFFLILNTRKLLGGAQ